MNHDPFDASPGRAATGAVSRRSFVALGAGSLALLSLSRARVLFAAPSARLAARPGKPGKTIDPGLHSLGLAVGRDALCYVPKSWNARAPAPFILALHGATQAGQLMATRLQPVADALGAPLLAPDSRGMTWDGIRGMFGEDVAFIDRAMQWVYDRCEIDPARIWLAGFSDGASYGLSLGLANGDLFSRVMAFSPGFMPPTDVTRRKPRIFVSHGTNDPILPIDRASRVLVPELTKAGYDVRYDEFPGGHQMPPGVIDAATHWLKDR